MDPDLRIQKEKFVEFRKDNIIDFYDFGFKVSVKLVQ